MAKREPGRQPRRSARSGGTVVVTSGQGTLGQLAKPVEAIYIRPTKSAITLAMHRTYNVMLARAVEQGLDRDRYRITTWQLTRDLETDSKNDEHLKDTARRLATTTVEWDYITEHGKRKWGVTAMIASLQIEEGGIIEYSFSAHLKEKLLDPDVYARLDLRLQNRFRSRHSLALYEHCIRYRDNPSRLTARLPWQQWAEMLVGSGDTEALALREFKYFSRDVLKPAIAEVNQVAQDIEIEGLIEKQGRRVTTLQFSVLPRRQAALALESAPSADSALHARIAAFGVAAAEIAQLVADFDAAALQAAVEFVEKRQRSTKLAALENPAAYFRHALQKRYAKPTSKAAPPVEPVDPEQQIAALREQFEAERAEQACAMYAEMDAANQADAFERFLETVASPQLKRAFKKAGPLDGRTVLTFTRWLAAQTWGEPKLEELLAFAAQRIGQAA